MISKDLKILILSNNEADVDRIRMELFNAGFAFHSLMVSKKADFEDVLQTFHPHLVLSDHTMADFDATEALRIYRYEKKRSRLIAPFIMVASSVSEEFVVRCMKQGAADYIMKDRLRQLPAAIRTAMEDEEEHTTHKKVPSLTTGPYRHE